MSLFKKKIDVRNPGDGKFTRLPHTFEIAYERQNLPDPASGNYSYETLGLVRFPPSGPSVAVRQPLNTLFSQMIAGFVVKLSGIPTTSGQLLGQPLYDPNAGYTRPTPMNIPATSDLNLPAQFDIPIGFNQPTPEKVR
ncbi:MAG: hypothetical protein KGL39_36570 [Patescibacteria group bacterium]|nr:hypothetical protein [Patescibacteria group bacterium]